jgi:hypothetical protein
MSGTRRTVPRWGARAAVRASAEGRLVSRYPDVFVPVADGISSAKRYEFRAVVGPGVGFIIATVLWFAVFYVLLLM